MSERDEFEAWFEADAMPAEANWFKRDPTDPDEYDSSFTHQAWKAWQAARAPRAVPAPVARLHITETDEWPDIRVEVLNGENLQPHMSPVDVYAAPQPSPDPKEPR